MTKSKKVTIHRDDQDSLILQKFGENLRKIREKAELSQEQVAYEAGFSRSYYTEVETGKRNISLLNILKICSFLKIEINDIIKLKDFSTK
ncbi:MAG: helix-turn-helix transcriptional regulator [Chitinophagaceae bacterium]